MLIIAVIFPNFTSHAHLLRLVTSHSVAESLSNRQQRGRFVTKPLNTTSGIHANYDFM